MLSKKCKTLEKCKASTKIFANLDSTTINTCMLGLHQTSSYHRACFTWLISNRI